MEHKPIALVTGANKGLGLAIVRQLGTKNHIVWMGCRDRQRGDAAADELRGTGIEAKAVLLDVTNDASVAAAVEHKTLSAKLTGEVAKDLTVHSVADIGTAVTAA